MGAIDPDGAGLPETGYRHTAGWVAGGRTVGRTRTLSAVLSLVSGTNGCRRALRLPLAAPVPATGPGRTCSKDIVLASRWMYILPKHSRIPVSFPLVLYEKADDTPALESGEKEGFPGV